MDELVGEASCLDKFTDLLDKACSDRIMRVWKEMLSTTVRDQNKNLSSLEEHIAFRIVETWAP